MKKQDRMLKMKGYRQSPTAKPGTTIEEHACNGGKIEIKTHTIRTMNTRGKVRLWSRSTIVPASTMR